MATDLINWEDVVQELMETITPQFLQHQLRHFSGGPAHPVGSTENYALAKRMESDWKSWGIPIVQLQDFFVLLPTGPPEGKWNEVLLIDSICHQVLHRAVNSVTIPSDAVPPLCNTEETNLQMKVISTCLPAYQAYSSPGDVCGPAVFVNYARPRDLEDFDKAQQRGPGSPSILCTPVIALARLKYGTLQSKIQALLRHCRCGEHGKPLPDHHVAALLLYPDPQDAVHTDGYTPVIYPDGPGLPGDAPVLGHACWSLCGGGNPCSPGLPSSAHTYEDGDAMRPGEALTPIPVQPIGYTDAGIVLTHLGGPCVPDTWDTKLAVHLGPSLNHKVRVVVNNTVSQEPVKCTNVIGVIPGDPSLSPDIDQYVIFGNHRDAWVQGACDPGSGTVLLQQLAFTLGGAYATGAFRPRRTLVFASWDGEECSLLGSTHTVETLAGELTSRAIAYINSDCPVKGKRAFNARTDSLLTQALINSAKVVPFDPPDDLRSLYDVWLQMEPDKYSDEPEISLPGGGSDHIPFAYKLGIPSTYPEFAPDGGRYNLPVYHTAYDTIRVVEKFTDPPPSTPNGKPLPRHRLMARLLLHYICQLVCSPRLPYSPGRLANNLTAEWNSVVKSADSRLPWLPTCGVHLEWITEDLGALARATDRLESFYTQWDSILPSSKIQINKILAGLPRQLNRQCRYYGGSCHFSNLLIGPKGYLSVYFPSIKAVLEKLANGDACLDNKNRLQVEIQLQKLKRELSELARCLRQATSWLGNGLLGIRELDEKQDQSNGWSA